MCGIYISECYDEDVISLILKRGLDSFKCIQFSSLYICSSVLEIRGTVNQPILGKDYVCVYNGEIYNGELSDTLYIKKLIDEALLISEDPEEFLQIIHTKINNFQNEFSLAIVTEKFVYCFKDDVGKKSVGFKKDLFQISSVKYDYELDNSVLYAYNIKSKRMSSYIKNTVLIKYLLQSRNILEAYLENGSTATEPILDNFAQIELMQSSGGNLEDFDSLLKLAFKRRLVDGNLVIFFSGGVDSILVALYLHLVSDISQEIYLINTGFKNSSDRANGLVALTELKRVFKDRNWIFIEVDLHIENIKAVKSDIYNLIYPKTSAMDFNIGVVLHFTAMEARKYSKVCYLGSGADELFCGYNKYKEKNTSIKCSFRHRMIFDTLSLSYHNLSRDDRLISNSNLESRLPLLDTDIINYSFLIGNEYLQNKIENKVAIREMLRKYGLDKISNFSKKAMQYGTGLNKYEKKIL